MPQISITEKDYTQPGNANYTNFSVVVPGFIASDKAIAFASVADDNGIYECSSVAAFETNVGKVETSKSNLPAKAPILTKFTPEVEGATEVEIGAMSPVQFGQYRTLQILYKGTEITETAKKVEGKLVKKITVGTTDKYYKFTKIESTTAYESTCSTYALIEAGNEGQDAVANAAIQMGNQIAYELLKQGYTVLYKKAESAHLDELAKASYWEALKDRSIYDFRFITNGYLSQSNADDTICTLATERGDCTALVSVGEEKFDATAKSSMTASITAIKNAVNGLSNADKYTGIIVPNVTYNFSNTSEAISTYKNDVFPGYFHYLACLKTSLDNNYAEWYAAAGYTRGICGYVIKNTSVKLGETALAALEPRTSALASKAVNVIIKEKTQYYLWGNRTAHELSTELKASHFLNIRQLSTTLNKQIYTACRRFTFDPNSDILWLNFCNLIKPTLERMKGDQGIKDYKILKVETSLKATLKARVRIIPIEAVEDFDIEISLEDSFGTTTATING